jgi:hypothetical protein
MTDDGQMIGVLRFEVTDSDQPAVTRKRFTPAGLKPGADSYDADDSHKDVPDKEGLAPTQSDPAKSN